MKFAALHNLWYLALIPLVVWLVVWGNRKRRALLSQLVASHLEERLLRGVSFSRRKLKSILLICAIFFMLMALIRPRWGFQWEEVKRRGVDIMIALDVSKSMLAEDVSPNRLERAKREIHDLLNLIEGDRVGLVAFAGTSFLQAPLTLDYGAVQMFLDDIDTEFIPVPGTAIAEALAKSVEAFPSDSLKSRVIILITDGEDHFGNPEEVAKKAAELKVKIYTIGIGQKGGAPIPDKKRGGFKKDENGEMVLTRLDEETLQKIALETGAKYVRSTTGDLDLERIYGDIQASVEDKELKSGKRKVFEERFQWPLLVGVIILLLELLISDRRNKFFIFSKQNINMSLVLFFLLLGRDVLALPLDRPQDEGVREYKKGNYQKALESFLDAQISKPNDADIKYQLANTYFKLKDFKNAEQLYRVAIPNLEGEAVKSAKFNLGLAIFHQGKLKEAAEHFEEMTKEYPDMEEAKKTLAITRKTIKKRLEELKKRQQKQAQNKSGGQNQNGEQKESQEMSAKDFKPGEEDKEGKDEVLKKEKDGKIASGKGKEAKSKKEEKAASGGNEKEKQQTMQGKVAGKDKGSPGENVKEQDAMRWLSTLKDDRKKYYQKRSQAAGRYRIQKDW